MPTKFKRLDITQNGAFYNNDGRFVEFSEIESKLKKIDKLLNKVNRVTSCHRHGRKVSEKDLTALSNAQLDYEAD